MRLAQLSSGGLGIVLGLGALFVVRAGPDSSLSGGGTAGVLLLLGAGWTLVAVGAVATRRRPESRFGLLLMAAGSAWFLVELPNPAASSSVLFTLGLLGSGLLPVVVAHAALAHPTGHLTSTAERVVVAVAYAGAVVATGLLPALTFDTGATGCSQCPANLVVLTGHPQAHAGLTRIGLQAALIWLPALVLIVVRRLVQSSSASRRLSGPVLVPAVAVAALALADDVHSLPRGFTSNDPTDTTLWTAQAAALLLLVLGVLTGWIRSRQARRTVARLTLQLGESRSPGRLREVLADALGDPGLELAYNLPGDRLVDALLNPIRLPPPAGRVATPLTLNGRTVTVLIHRPDLRDDVGLLGEVVAAAGLAMHHERLQTEVRTQLDDLRASRARTVAAGDDERRRLERDLHDGAQQRLVALALTLRLLRSELAPVAQTRLDAAIAELGRALSDLRTLANGIYPAVLTDEGLASAVDALEEAGPQPIAIDTIPPERLPPRAEAAAYFLLLDVLRTPGATGVSIRADLEDTCLHLCIGYDGQTLPDGIVDLEDRVGALDGHLTVQAAPGHFDLRAKIPCAS